MPTVVPSIAEPTGTCGVTTRPTSPTIPEAGAHLSQEISDSVIADALERDPREEGFLATTWTVPLLATDWTILRLFPPLRSAWAREGEQGEVRIRGRNAMRALFGTIDLRTGYRAVIKRKQMGGEDGRAMLSELRKRYRGWGTIWLLIDRAPGNVDRRTQALAERLRIKLVWLPTQALKLNPMDQLWHELKRLIAATLPVPQ